MRKVPVKGPGDSKHPDEIKPKAYCEGDCANSGPKHHDTAKMDGPKNGLFENIDDVKFIARDGITNKHFLFSLR
jgi:hypothetical protein